MTRFVTAAGMKQLEALCARMGVDSRQMMENAGQSAAAVLAARWPMEGRPVLILCGKGNNGGDGFVVARALAEEGARVTAALVLGHPAAQEAAWAFSLLPREVEVAEGIPAAVSLCQGAELVVDGIFGTGFRGGVPAELKPLFWAVGESGAPVAALDIPSGVEVDSGRWEDCIPAEVTVAFGALKPAHLVNWSREYSGETVLGSIGAPKAAEEAFDGWLKAADLSWVWENRPRRSHTGHKGSNGRLLLVAGSRCYPGAALLAAGAAVRSGVGYVRLASVGEVRAAAAVRVPEAIHLPCRETVEGTISGETLPEILEAARGSDAIAAGCGMTPGPGTLAIVEGLLKQEKPLVLDADALNVLAGRTDLLKEAVCPVLITPHPGEYARLAGLDAGTVGNNPFSEEYTMAKDFGITVLLKGFVTSVTGPGGHRAFHFGGCDGLAKGGSGDVLTGLVGGLLARGFAPERAALWGAWAHGRAAQLAAADHSPDAMVPSMLPEYFGRAFLEAE
jgi:hydroxyethylthiazole kinase-like uncharacterized protein yjeF